MCKPQTASLLGRPRLGDTQKCLWGLCGFSSSSLSFRNRGETFTTSSRPGGDTVFDASWGLLNCGLVCFKALLYSREPEAEKLCRTERAGAGTPCFPAGQAGRKLCGVTSVLVGNLLSCSHWGSGGGAGQGWAEMWLDFLLPCSGEGVGRGDGG